MIAKIHSSKLIAKLHSSEIFKVLSVGTRIRIIELLKSEGPIGVKDIAKRMNITQAAVSQHLKLMKQAGLVSSERKGYWIPYSINEKAMEHCRMAIDEICRCGCYGMHGIEDTEGHDLGALRKYKKKLEKELDKVNKMISDIK